MADSSWQDLGTPVPADASGGIPRSADGTPHIYIGGQGPDWKSLGTPVPEQQGDAEPALTAQEKAYRTSANHGWIGKIYSALGGFNDQMGRAITMGLSDKVAALQPATIHAAAKGVNALYDAVGSDKPFPEAEGENFSDIYHDELAKQRAASERYSQEHPYASLAAKGLGTVASIPMTAGAGIEGMGLEAGATLGAKVLHGVKSGATLGGIGGFGNSNDESLVKDLIQTGMGAAVGGGLGVGMTLAGEKIAAPIANWVSGKFGADAVDNAATKQILERISKSAEGGGPTAQDMLDIMSANHGKPLMLADVGGEPVKGLGERIANTPGAGRQTAVSALNTRDAGAGTRMGQDLSDAFGSAPGSNYRMAQDLSQIQKDTSLPAYKKAFQGGSIAPLESQFRTALQEATGAKGQIAKQIADIEQNNSGALAARGAAGADVRAKYMDLRTQLEQAENQRQQAMTLFKKAQADGSANAPGAVWSPHLQEFLDDPIMKPGISRGLEIQRLESVGSGDRFNPSEYAIVGTNPDGTPMVGSVPNMRLADAGKRGIDAMIGDEEVAPGQFTERGKALIGFKNRYVAELKRLNPDYEPALNAYSGPAASKSAIAMGEHAMVSGKVDPDQIADQIAKLAPGDQELYKLGGMNALKTQIGNSTPGANEALKIMGTDNIKKRITALAGSQDKADRLISGANLEDLMKRTATDTLGSSRSGLRLAEQAAANPEQGVFPALVQTAAGAMTGEPVASSMGALNLGKKLLGAMNRQSPAADAAVARMLFNPDATANQQALARIMAMGRRPSLTPSLTRPIVQGGAQIVPRAVNLPYINPNGEP